MMQSVFKMLAVTGLAALALTACSERETQVAPETHLFAHEVSDLPVDPAIRYGSLPNGMRYAILENAYPSNVAAVRLVFNIGSMAESEEQRGLAHFIEHMAFNGSTHVEEGDMVPLLERHGLAFGPDTNAFTGYETVGYQLDLPEADDGSIDTALFLMRETASELLLDSEAIDRERGVILSEARFRNSPIRRWNSALSRFRFPDTLIPDRDPIGTIEVIETAQRDQFVDYYENYYIPQRAFLVVTGDISADEIEAKIFERFADWTGPEDPRPDPQIGSVDAARPFSVGYLHDPEVFTIFTVDAIRPAVERPDTAQNRFENNLATLGDAILSRRLETIISSGASPLLQAGAGHGTEFEIADSASVFAVLAPERWEDGVILIEQELRRALTYGFTRAELNEQLAIQRAQLEAAADQASTRDSAALADSIWGSWRSDNVVTTPQSALERYESFLPGITLEAVDAAFQANWQGVEPLIFLASSIELPDGHKAVKDVWMASASVELEAPVDAGEAIFAYTDFGPAGTVASRDVIADLGLVRVEFANGVRVSFKQTDFEAGQVDVRIDFGAGELEPRAAPAVDVITSSVFAAAGLGELSLDQLSSALAGRNVGLGFSVGESSFVFSAGTTPDDLLTQLQVFAAYLSDPGWRDEGYAQFRAVAPELRRNFASSPLGVLQTEVSRRLRSGDPRYGFPSPAEVDAVSMTHIRDFLSPALEAAPIEITIIGDIDEAAALQAVASTFGALPDRAESWSDYPEAREIAFPAANASPLELRHNGQAGQAMVNIYWPTVDGEDVHRRRALGLLQSVFDLKLTERLREQDGFTYSVFSDDLASTTYPGYGYLWVGVDVATGDVDAAYRAVDELAAALAAGDISEDELLRARRPTLEQIEEAMENNGAWLSWVSRSWREPSRLDRIRTVAADYESITRDELVDLANTYLVGANSWRVTILPGDAGRND